MRRKRFQRGSLKAHKRRGKMLLVCAMERGGQAKNERNRALLRNEQNRGGIDAARDPEADQRRSRADGVKDFTFESFVELTYLPVYRRKWKGSTAMTEVNQAEFHLVGGLGDRTMREINREELQAFLDANAKDMLPERG